MHLVVVPDRVNTQTRVVRVNLFGSLRRFLRKNLKQRRFQLTAQRRAAARAESRRARRAAAADNGRDDVKSRHARVTRAHERVTRARE